MRKTKKPDTSGIDFLRIRLDQELDKDDACIDWQFIDDKMDDILKANHWNMNWAPDPEEAYGALMARAKEGPSGNTNRSAGEKEKKRKRRWPAAVLTASLAFVLVGGVYAGQFSTSKFQSPLFFNIRAKNTAVNYTRTDFQTDNPLYQTLEQAHMPEVLLPSPSSVSDYSIQVDGPYTADGISSALLRWTNGDRYIHYEITYYGASDAFSIQRSVRCTELETISRDGLDMHLCRFEQTYSVGFQANNAFYMIQTNLARSDLIALLDTIH